MCGEKGHPLGPLYQSRGSPPRVRGKGQLLRCMVVRFRITPACAGKSAVAAENRLLIPGSPPRVRGKGPEFVAVVLLAGITPAYAGKSAVKSLLCHRVGDHPRVCGEKFRLTSVTTPQRGSPPRMRGKELSVSAHCHICGITPAYAGKSEAVNGPGIAGKDHPRVCGEKRVPPLIGFVCTGSPPRMRGKGCVIHYACPPYGITPAYAGKRIRVLQKTS